MIPVVKPYLPRRDVLNKYLDSIYESKQLTNNGPLVQELETRLALELGVDKDCLVLVANGSLALHLAYKVLGLSGEVITTPFSFVATASTLYWEGLSPVFSDISGKTWNLNPDLIEAAISSSTSAIVPVHVFGNPCDVGEIQDVADKHDLRIIYDASHCFGVNLGGESVLKNGDVSTISFHATKLFNTVEGGAVITRTRSLAYKIKQMINFGIDEHGSISSVGTNAKMSEFHAAMGLAVLDEIQVVYRERKRVWNAYAKAFENIGRMQVRNVNASNNFAYFPLLLSSEREAMAVLQKLKINHVYARRYFYPSLDKVGYFRAGSTCKKSVDIASRILCLPLYPDLSDEELSDIVGLLQEVIEF